MCRFQIVDLPGAVDSDANNGSWRIGDWADTLELPNIGLQAVVRWIPGPLEITGRVPHKPVYACLCQSIQSIFVFLSLGLVRRVNRQ